MNRNRIIILAVAIIILALVAVGIYWTLNRSPDGSETDGNLPEIGGDFKPLDPAGNDALAAAAVKVTNVAAYHAFPDGAVAVVHRDGTISRVVSSTVTALSAKPVEGFASASFSADGSKILVLTGNQPRSQANIFDVASASWRIIPGSFRDATWGPFESQLATLTPDETTGKTAVGIYDTNLGKTTQTVLAAAFGDVSITWPATSTIIVADKPNRDSQGSSWSVDIPSKRLTISTRNRLGYYAAWDKTGRNSVAFTANVYGTGGRTRLIADGVDQSLLSFTTFPDKCVFFDLPAGDKPSPHVICAVPNDQDGIQTRVLPDAYLRREFFTDDTVVAVNLDTQDVDITFAPPVSMDVADLQVVGTTVYYVNRRDNTLYRESL